MAASLREKPFFGLGAAAGAAVMVGTGRPISSLLPVCSINTSLAGAGAGVGATAAAGGDDVAAVGTGGVVAAALGAVPGIDRPGIATGLVGRGGRGADDDETEDVAADSIIVGTTAGAATAAVAGENGESGAGEGWSPLCDGLVGVELGGVKMSDDEDEDGVDIGEENDESAPAEADGAGEDGTAAAAVTAGWDCCCC